MCQLLDETTCYTFEENYPISVSNLKKFIFNDKFNQYQHQILYYPTKYNKAIQEMVYKLFLLAKTSCPKLVSLG